MLQQKTIKNTDTHNEYQYKKPTEIVNEIVSILLKNDNMTTAYGKEILRESIHALETVAFNKEYR